ncbi:MAG: hypothetical protein QW086_10205 [Pyrobaculum sp.]
MPADIGCWDVFGATRFGFVWRLATSLGVSVLGVYMLGVAAPLDAGGLLGVGGGVCGFVDGLALWGSAFGG